ncbi:hypothetical protein D3C79_848530 [compost metagenome]
MRQGETLGDVLAMAAPQGVVGFQRGGEIKTTQQFGVLVRVGPQQAVDELLQAWLERGQFEREAVGGIVLAGYLNILLHQLLARHLLPIAGQLVHSLAEALAPVGLFIAFVRERLAHHLAARCVIQLAVEGCEAWDQVAFGEHQVDGQAYFQQGAAFLDTLAQALGHTLLVFGRAMQDIGDADADDQPVEWPALAVLA